MKLDMLTFLAAYENDASWRGRDLLLEQGYPAKMIWERAERYTSRGYFEYGVTPWTGWLTPKGVEKLAELRAAPVSKESTE